MKKNFFAVLQKIGKSLMMPVSVLPAAGLLVALGRMVDGPNWLVHGLGQIMFSGGNAIFENLPIVFAIGVAIGFSGGAGVAGLAAAVGYFTMNNVINVIQEISKTQLTINTGVFGGIVIGILAAWIYNRYSQIKLPSVLGFFSGKRLIPIITVTLSIVIGILFGFTWPPIQNEINKFGVNVMGSAYGPAFYAAGKRLLIPVGLHHVYYQPFLFQFGEFINSAGKIVHGESARYFAGDPTAGRFMAAEYPIMLFGLPAAALAMYATANKNRRKAIGSIMFTAALTSILTGITEPIEFAFIFVAPILYVFHVVAAFLSGILTSYFNIHLGYTFSASLIDYVLGFYNEANSIYLFIIVGPIIGLLYFNVFYWSIKFLNIKTPGREDVDYTEVRTIVSSQKALEILKAVGGAENVDDIDACITRLRFTVYNPMDVDKKRLKQLGCSGMLDAGRGTFQAIFGTESDMLKEEIKNIVDKEKKHRDTYDYNIENNDKNNNLLIKSPMSGTIVMMEDVPDDVFAEKMLGEGIAINPSEGIVYSPVDGEVVELFATNHAIGVLTESNVEILIHIGIDTVKMDGRGFKPFVCQGHKVKAGDKLIEFDMNLVKKEAKSIISPIIITNSEDFKRIDILKEETIKKKEDLLNIVF